MVKEVLLDQNEVGLIFVKKIEVVFKGNVGSEAGEDDLLLAFFA